MKPLIIYIAEDDHGDMSYGSLTEKIIKDCHAKGLSTKTFSEFPSQTAKSQKQKVRNGLEEITTYQVTDDVMTLERDRVSVEQTSEFLDQQFIEMGLMEERYERYKATFESLEPNTTTKELIDQRRGFVDNPELLEMMELDAKTGEISGADKIGDLENFYAYWRSPMHYTLTHERMVEHVSDGLKEENPDVIIISVGSPHIPGLDKKLASLSPFQDSQKIVVGKFPTGLEGLDNYVFGGTPEECKKVGKLARFDVDLEKREALIPELIAITISDKQKEKRVDFLGPQSATKKAIDGTLSVNSVIMVNPNEVYQDRILSATADEVKIGDPNEIAYMASIGKILTARTAVEYFKNLDLKLSDLLQDYPEGKSAFIDDLKRLPHYENITIAHLLNHTAGLQQFSQKGFDKLTTENNQFLTSEQILSQELDVNPNVKFGKFNYSNVGYELVGLILEHHSGKTFENLQRELVLKPAGLDEEIFLRDDLKVVGNGNYSVKNHPEKNLLLGQHFDGTMVNNLPNLSHHAGAGIYANPQSVARLVEKIWTQENLEQLQRYEVPIDEKGTKYGIGYIRNGNIINHDGGMDGVRSSVMLDMTTGKAGCVVATLENLTPKLAPKIDEIGPEKHYQEIEKLRMQPKQELIDKINNMKAKTFFLVGPNVHHIKELEQAKDQLTKLGRLQVFEVNSSQDYQFAIEQIKLYYEENPSNKIRIVTDAHGVEIRENGVSRGTGKLGFGDKEIYPAEIAQDLANCNIEFIDNSACCIGTGIASKDNENINQYQNILPNIPIILNGGKLRAITTLLQPEIIKTLNLTEEESALENFLNKQFHPNTLKILVKKEDGELITHKISAPKPKSPNDVSLQAVGQHLDQEITKAVNWWRDNVDSSINGEAIKKQYQEKITPELIEQYRSQALIMEAHRKKDDYVKYYIEAGTDPNYTTFDGMSALHVSCTKIEVMKELLKSRKVNVNHLDVDKISVLCVASYSKNSKEAVDLILNHPNFNQNLEDFNNSREALKNIYLKDPKYHNMNNPLVNYVRAELSFREGKSEEAKKYITISISEEIDIERKKQYQERSKSYYERAIDDLDLAKPNSEQKGKAQEKSWVEKMEDKKLSSLKSGVREI
jgi:CubicO group peptidase (beta-lactamase class C family)